jgi:hypothetical protein
MFDINAFSEPPYSLFSLAIAVGMVGYTFRASTSGPLLYKPKLRMQTSSSMFCR